MIRIPEPVHGVVDEDALDARQVQAQRRRQLASDDPLGGYLGGELVGHRPRSSSAGRRLPKTRTLQTQAPAEPFVRSLSKRCLPHPRLIAGYRRRGVAFHRCQRPRGNPRFTRQDRPQARQTLDQSTRPAFVVRITP